MVSEKFFKGGVYRRTQTDALWTQRHHNSWLAFCQWSLKCRLKIETCCNSLPNDIILDRSKLKAFADDKVNVIEN